VCEKGGTLTLTWGGGDVDAGWGEKIGGIARKKREERRRLGMGKEDDGTVGSRRKSLPGLMQNGMEVRQGDVAVQPRGNKIECGREKWSRRHKKKKKNESATRIPKGEQAFPAIQKEKKGRSKIVRNRANDVR